MHAIQHLGYHLLPQAKQKIFSFYDRGNFLTLKFKASNTMDFSISHNVVDHNNYHFVL